MPIMAVLSPRTAHEKLSLSRRPANPLSHMCDKGYSLEKAGVVFIGDPVASPGVQLQPHRPASKSKARTRPREN